MKKIILKSILALGVIAFAASMLAVSCGKTAGGNNNNNNNSGNNSGGNNGGGDGNGDGGSGGCTGICPTTNLVLAPASTMPSYVKISGNNATINAAGLAGAITPHSDANADNRGFEDTIAAARKQLFVIEYPGATAVMFFINRASVSTNSITMPATSATACSSSETGDEALATAAGGGNCRVYSARRDEIDFQNYLGTVFNNTDVANHARGSIRCNIGLSNYDAVSTSLLTITDTITFNQYSRIVCYIAVVNSAGAAATAEIDDAWVGDSGSTTEVELYAIGIDVTGKTIPKWSDETGYGVAEFKKAHDNAKFKRLLQNNPWGELKFKVRIVTAANF